RHILDDEVGAVDGLGERGCETHLAAGLGRDAEAVEHAVDQGKSRFGLVDLHRFRIESGNHKTASRQAVGDARSHGPKSDDGDPLHQPAFSSVARIATWKAGRSRMALIQRSSSAKGGRSSGK